jgi:hypothetical protein
MKNVSDKTTFIYGLIDPKTKELRYVGKTVDGVEKRIAVHVSRAKTQPHKIHSMAWLESLRLAGLRPDGFVIEEIAAGEDWVNAEQFWIAYFRSIGANLCNHTIGGEGQTGYKQPKSHVEKRIRFGEDHHNYGKPMPAKTAEALRIGGEKLRSDPVRNAAAIASRKAGMTPEIVAASVSALNRFYEDPEARKAVTARRESSRTEDSRLAVSRQSTKLWKEKRSEIILAQNQGKDDAWKEKQSIAKKQQWLQPNNNMALAMKERRKITDEDVYEIRKSLLKGATQASLALRYGVNGSMISMIKTGRRRPQAN